MKSKRAKLACKIVFLSLLTFSMSLFLSCEKKKSLSRLALPPSTRISTEGRFALISDPYVSLRDIPGSDGITVAHARRGDVLTVKGTKLLTNGKETALWLDLGSGWVIVASVQLYSNQARALAAARLIETDPSLTK